MLESDSPSAEEYKQAFCQRLEQSRRRSQTLLLLLACARMQDDAYSLYLESQAHTSPIKRLLRCMRSWMRRRATAAPPAHQQFPWGLHGYYAVCDSQFPLYRKHKQRRSSSDGQPSTVGVADDASVHPEPRDA